MKKVELGQPTSTVQIHGLLFVDHTTIINQMFIRSSKHTTLFRESQSNVSSLCVRVKACAKYTSQCLYIPKCVLVRITT